MATILVVDDEPDVRLALVALLEDAGHDVLEAADGAEAMPLLARHVPDMVLLDVAMPRQGGFDTLREIRASPEFRDLPVVMVSAMDRISDLATARSLRADGYVTKPWAGTEVEDLVARILERRREE